MAHCAICGDEEREHLTPVRRFWSPDDGWRMGRMCRWCWDDLGARKPHPDDYAYDKRGDYVSDEDEAIDAICG